MKPRAVCLLVLLVLPSCVGQDNLDRRLEGIEQARIQRDMLEVQREMLLLTQLRRR